MSKRQTIKGLGQQEVFLLYKYLAFYETKIKLITKDSELKAIAPNILSFLKGTIKPVKFIQYRKNTLPNKIPPSNTIYYVKHNTQIQSLLYHLRNAIAHALIQKESKTYYIKDFSDKRQKIMTMSAHVDTNIIESLIKKLLQ